MFPISVKGITSTRAGPARNQEGVAPSLSLHSPPPRSCCPPSPPSQGLCEENTVPCLEVPGNVVRQAVVGSRDLMFAFSSFCFIHELYPQPAATTANPERRQQNCLKPCPLPSDLWLSTLSTEGRCPTCYPVYLGEWV